MIDPPGDARPDLYFWVELGKRFGLHEVLKEEYKNSSVFFDRDEGQSSGQRGYGK